MSMPADFDYAPDCPTCELPLDWCGGDEGDFYNPPEAPGWDCAECGRQWDQSGPTAADYRNAELARQEAAEDAADEAKAA